ncbi:hypothetical protein ACJJTC_016572 [Scirpophaga incertulas]
MQRYNIIEPNTDNSSEIYLDMLASHGQLPGHRFDTRANSCIDHVITNLNPKTHSAIITVLDTTVTDHKMVSTCIYKNQIKTDKPPKTKISVNYDKALKELQSISTDHLLSINDSEEMTKELIALLTKIINNNSEIKSIPRSKRIIKPWMTQGILRCIKNRNNLQGKLRQDQTNEVLRITYKRYRNFCNNLIKSAKFKYEQELLNKNKNNNKALWNSIKTITHLNKQITNSTDLIKIKSNPTDSADHINHYFNNVGKSLAEETETNYIKKILFMQFFSRNTHYNLAYALKKHPTLALACRGVNPGRQLV